MSLQPPQGHYSRTLLLLTLLLLGYGASTAADSYYQWQDAGGVPHFGDSPPATAIHLNRVDTTLQHPLYKVERVIDGDTIVVEHGGKVRLLGINAPEIAHRTSAAEPLGNRAHHRLQQLLEGQRVYLEFDQRHRDPYNRLLAHVILEDGTEVNALLLREGLARALFLQPNMRHLQHYYQVEGEAQTARRGIWSRPEYRVRPSNKAGACLKHFCQLRGKVLKLERKRIYTTLKLPGKLDVTIKNEYLPQFLSAGINIDQMEGATVIVRGWMGKRNSQLTLQLQHPLQIQSIGP
jgi:endonuclease YncB( thermonuclease family)